MLSERLFAGVSNRQRENNHHMNPPSYKVECHLKTSINLDLFKGLQMSMINCCRSNQTESEKSLNWKKWS